MHSHRWRLRQHHVRQRDVWRPESAGLCYRRLQLRWRKELRPMAWVRLRQHLSGGCRHSVQCRSGGLLPGRLLVLRIREPGANLRQLKLRRFRGLPDGLRAFTLVAMRGKQSQPARSSYRLTTLRDNWIGYVLTDNSHVGDEPNSMWRITIPAT